MDVWAYFNIATSLTDDTPIKLNISETIGFGTKRPIKPTDGESYFMTLQLLIEQSLYFRTIQKYHILHSMVIVNRVL